MKPITTIMFGGLPRATSARVFALHGVARRSSMASPRSSSGPLSGVKILDLSRILAGPFATATLGDMGADVIKVEKPKTGDDTVRLACDLCKFMIDHM